MLNQIVICGRLTHDPEIIELENGKKGAYITVAVPRPYKNIDGIYETDFIKCKLWDGIAQNTSEYCHKGDIVGVKGRIQTTETEEENGDRKYTMEIVAEKLTFLSSSRKDEE